jgi:hypothetical protein
MADLMPPCEKKMQRRGNEPPGKSLLRPPAQHKQANQAENRPHQQATQERQRAGADLDA